jgi:UDP-glucose 4-epimerase
MKILVTGGAGFIGSHIVDAYVADGHEVTVVDDLSRGKKANVNPDARLAVMDLRDPDLERLFSETRFDVVNHHASQIDVRRSVAEPQVDASINIFGALRLLECAAAAGVKRFIFASSGGAVYGECPTSGAREEDPLHPESPYAISKAAVEYYIRFYGAVRGVPYTILRYANVYGPRQDPQGEAGVISIFIDKFLAGEPATVYGTGDQVRDYVHVSDVVEANRAALLRGEGRTFNIGTTMATSVNDLFGKLKAMTGSRLDPVSAPRRAGEVERSLLNNSAAARGLGWIPSRALDHGLDDTLRYFREKNKIPVGA